MGRRHPSSTNPNIHSQSHEEKKPQYISWNRVMDDALMAILTDQMNQGNKCDGDWKPQAYQAVVDHINSTLKVDLTKENVKNRLKAWKRYYRVIADIQLHSGNKLLWDENRKMVLVTSENDKEWEDYCKRNPDARGLQNKVIDNWDGIVLLCANDKPSRRGPKAFKNAGKATAATDGEGENEVDSLPLAGPTTQSSSSTSAMHESHQRKRLKRDSLADSVSDMATSLKQYLESKKKENDQPAGVLIYNVVSKIPGLSRVEIFKAVQKLIRGHPEEFNLLKALPNEEKIDWIRFLITA